MVFYLKKKKKEGIKMINVKKICRIGRPNLLLEVNDNLQVNDFFNVSGVLHTTVHGTFSRINLCLVDTKAGKKSKAKIFDFNFTIEQIHIIINNLGVFNFQNINELERILTPELFKENIIKYNKEIKNKDYNFAYSLKVNPYKKDTQGLSPVNKIMLSYENQMTSIYKWKITFENGLAIANTGKDAFIKGAMKSGTYKKLSSSSINISQHELLELITSSIQHISLWEASNYNLMLENREDFMERFKKSDYNESTIDLWNNKVELKINNNLNKSENLNNIPNNNNNLITYKCTKCGYEVDENIKKFSEKKFGKTLCIKCQKENSSTTYKCNKCGYEVDENIKQFSKKKFGEILCIKCQKEKQVIF